MPVQLLRAPLPLARHELNWPVLPEYKYAAAACRSHQPESGRIGIPAVTRCYRSYLGIPGAHPPLSSLSSTAQAIVMTSSFGTMCHIETFVSSSGRLRYALAKFLSIERSTFKYSGTTALSSHGIGWLASTLIINSCRAPIQPRVSPIDRKREEMAGYVDPSPSVPSLSMLAIRKGSMDREKMWRKGRTH